MDAVAKPIKLDDAYEDPGAIRTLVERAGPFPSIASYLPATATRDANTDVGAGETLPWFRGNWAVNGRAVVEGADAILHNARFIEAASRLFDTPNVTPSTVVVNINAPMPAGAVHVDIPAFRGATRDGYPLPLLQAMGASGLFEPWRVVEAGAVSWFYDGPGGAYDYWPEGLEAPMCSEGPPFGNVALVADNDRMYHRIGWVGDPAAPTPSLSAASEIRSTGAGTWAITDAGDLRASYPAERIRISVLWKARIGRDDGSGDAVGTLSPDRVVDVIAADLRARGVDAPVPGSPLTDASWIDLVHATYYPVVTVND